MSCETWQLAARKGLVGHYHEVQELTEFLSHLSRRIKLERKARKKQKIEPWQAELRLSKGEVPISRYVTVFDGPHSVQRVVSWSLPRYRNSHALRGIIAASPKSIQNPVFDEEVSHSDYEDWILALINYSDKKLSAYTNFISQADSLATNIGSMPDEVVRIAAITGWSYTLIQTLMFAYRRKNGLEAQRQWMRSALYSDQKRSISNFVYYAMGVQTEGGVDPRYVDEYISETLISPVKSQVLKSFLERVLWLNGVHPEAHIENRLISPNQPLIDNYEGIWSWTVSTLHMPNENANFVEKFLSVAKHLRDWRSCAYIKVKPRLRGGSVLLPLMPADMRTDLKNLFPENSTNESDSLWRANVSCSETFNVARGSPYSIIAKGVYTCRNSIGIGEILYWLNYRELAISTIIPRHTECPERQLVRVDFDSLSLHLNQNELVDEEVFRLAILSGLTEGKTLQVLEFCYRYLKRFPQAIHYVPHDSILSEITDSILDMICESREAILALSYLRCERADRHDEVIYLAVESFLWSQGCEVPSKLEDRSAAALEILSDVCGISVLRQSLEFDTWEEMEAERVSILQLLIDADPKNCEAYNSELQSLIGQQAAKELLRKFNFGKVQCDERGIREWARTVLVQKYHRLNQFLSAGLLPIEKGAAYEFLAHVSSGETEAFTFKVPNHEAYEIATQIVGDLLDKFSFDPRFGLDSYLSLGMRHGAISAQLRSPLSQESLITQKDASGYLRNEFWAEYLDMYCDDAIFDQVQTILAKFSESIDHNISHIKDEMIHVKSVAKPAGIISTEWLPATRLAFISEIERFSDVDDLLVGFAEIFWVNVEKKLDEVRAQTLHEIEGMFKASFDSLEADIKLLEERNLAPLFDAINRAKNHFSIALREFGEWLRVTRPTDSEPIALLDIIEASRAVVRRFYGDFHPTLRLHGGDNVSLDFAIQALIEVFNVLFTNVRDHSGDLQCEVDVSIFSEDPSKLRIVFASDCTDLPRAHIAASDAMEKINSGEYELRIPKEGGSGLAKIARSTYFDGHPHVVVSVDDEKGRFVVDMTFAVLSIKEH